MFPENPSMICCRCGEHYSIDHSSFDVIKSHSRFECPSCKYEVTEHGSIKAFFNFYPRLVKSENELNKSGIYIINYTIGELMKFGKYWLLKQQLEFQCSSCNHNWLIEFDPDTVEYKNKPKSFSCPNCSNSPASKITKEFFMSLNQVHDSMVNFVNAQWDLFTPIGFVPPIKKIQHKIYRNEYKIN